MDDVLGSFHTQICSQQLRVRGKLVYLEAESEHVRQKVGFRSGCCLMPGIREIRFRSEKLELD